MTNTELKAQIDSQITNETSANAITPTDVGTNLKDIVDYVDQQDELSEVLENKSIDVTTDGASDTKYPSVKAVKTYVDANAGTPVTKVVKTTITTAQVLQLFTTPITILNSDNPLTVAYPINVYIKRKLGDAYTLATNTFSVLNDFNTVMTGNLNPNPLVNTDGYFQSAITVAQNLSGGDKNVLYKLRANVGNPTLGTGDLDVYVTYVEITL